MISLGKITQQGRAMFLAYDQGLEHGPADFNEESVDPGLIVDIAEKGNFTGLILQKGVAEKYYDRRKTSVPLIVKLNGKTSLVKDEDPYSPLVCSVQEALDLGAAAVGYTIYVGSEHEGLMTAEFGRIQEEGHEAGLPVIGWMYPRGRNIPDEHDPKVVAYAARVGLELGADLVKVRYTGDPVTFHWVIENAGKAKVVVMGGAKESESVFLERVGAAMSAGAIGVAVGRNVWQAEQPLAVARKLREVVFG